MQAGKKETMLSFSFSVCYPSLLLLLFSHSCYLCLYQLVIYFKILYMPCETTKTQFPYVRATIAIPDAFGCPKNEDQEAERGLRKGSFFEIITKMKQTQSNNVLLSLRPSTRKMLQTRNTRSYASTLCSLYSSKQTQLLRISLTPKTRQSKNRPLNGY